MKKAEITVYLALILSVMLSLILSLVEGARLSAIRMQVECVTDMGLNSCFAEYNRELLKQYDLLFIDTAYETGKPAIENMEVHLSDYIKYNYYPTTDLITFSPKDWLALEVGDVVIEEASMATDNHGLVCKRQAINYINEKISLDLVKSIQKQSEVMNNKQLETRDIESESREIDYKLNNLEREENGKKKKVHLKSPANEVNESKGVGILGLIIDDIGAISSQSVQLDEYTSHRKRNSGAGIPKGHEMQDSFLEEILFGEYLLEKCGDYTKQKEISLLKYQLEYILFGKNSDKENLKEAANKLVLVRQVSNIVYLWTDSAKVAEVDAAAAGIASAVLMPEIQPIVKASLMFAWAYAESIGDMRILLGGGKVPLLKTSEDWNLQFSNLKDYNKHIKNVRGSEKGLTYREYLRLFLLTMNKENKTERFMDVIEMDLRKTAGNKMFQLDGCADSIVANIESISKFGYRYDIKRFYCYE